MITLARSFKIVISMLRLTIIGFGNQAKAWCQNLKDSGFSFRVALRPDSPSFYEALKQGFNTIDINSAALFEDRVFVLLIPDLAHAEVLEKYGKHFKSGSTILYNHGFSLIQNEFQIKYPDLNHVLYAVKSIGKEIRAQYLKKGRLGAVYSLEHYQANKVEFFSWINSLSLGLGVNLGPYQTTFLHETQADLFSEQGLLCSLIPYTASEVFSELVQNGIEPELAYLECWEELQLIVNAMVEMGPQKFYDMISPNALVGSEKGFEKLFTPEFKNNLRSLFTDIKTKRFEQELSHTDPQDVRSRISARWGSSPLVKTFNSLNSGSK
jgi:ketol-acid reductoisomerase